MKITVITVCFNSAATIERTITSVLSQSYHNIEYIIVDGASTDHTLDIVKKYSAQISKVVSEPDSGIYFAMNKGIHLATGDVIAFLNSDDYYADNEVITHVIQAFEHTNADTVYGDLHYVSGQSIIRTWKSSSYYCKNFLWGWMPPHPAFFAKKKLYDQFGLFNTTFLLSADYEIMLRFLYKYKASAHYIPELLVKMETGGISNKHLHNRLKAYEEDQKAWEVNALKPYFFTILLKKLRKILQYIIA